MNSSVSGRLLDSNTIENDSMIVDRLLLAAKSGQWNQVWEILGPPENPKYDRFFNSIPENRRWGILHQGVYWNNRTVMSKLLSYPACDTDTQVKKCTSECGKTTKMTALEIARAYKYPDMIAALSEHSNKIEEQPAPTFQSADNYNASEGLSLISVTLSAYKKSFHPTPIDPNKGILTLLGDIFKDLLNSDERWKAIQEKVYDSVYVVCERNANLIKSCTTREEFFEHVITTYTVEENRMYTYLNLAFRRQKCKHYRPTGHDLALGPYAVVYQMLLLFWDKLTRERGTTYRRMLLTKSDADEYSLGKRFVWQSVASSSTDLQYAMPFPTCGVTGDQAVIFTINNQANSTWQPRNIEKFAVYMEKERTYPAGAKFIVTGRSRKGSDIHVSLSLLSG